ncbi:MAG: energy-coupled thiamine transporter ThiT [Clostridia bacterium]|nr:energy-coupled thiamine transporter ThiT [Clostridia bacterium]
MKNKTLTLCECAVLVALAFVLSLVKVPLPFGGSVTLCSMVPLVIAAQRNGAGWGFFSAGVFSVVKLLLGLENFSYVSGAVSFVCVLLFDYLLAYTAVGISGFFRPSAGDTKRTLCARAGLGALVGMVFRYGLHVISGAAVWYDLTKAWEEDPSNMVFRYGKWMYSVVYNAIYMIPETILTVVVVIAVTAVMNKSKSIEH